MPMRVLRQCLLLALYLVWPCQLLVPCPSCVGRMSIPGILNLVEFTAEFEIIVIPDGVASPQSNPLGDRAVLLLRLCELLLRAERLVGLRSLSSASLLYLSNLVNTYRHLDCLPEMSWS